MQKLYYSFIVLLIGFFAKAQTTTAPISPTPAISPIGIGLFAAPIGGGGGGGSYKWNADMDRDGFGDPYTYVMANTKPYGYVSNQSDYDDSNPKITNIPPQTFYRDADGDSYGSPTVTVYYSVKPAGYVTNNLDCNDGDATLNPNTVWYRDADGDGYGTSAISTKSCTQPTAYVRNASDYNDGTAKITNIAPRTFYKDLDGDTYGNPNASVYYSVMPGGYVINNLDCNDGDGSLNPNTVWYRDADGDGYGTSAISTKSCTQPTGYVRNASDYNDGTGNITNIAPQTFYRDADGDGYGSPTVTVYYSNRPAGYVTNSSDCNDTDGSLNPTTVWYRDADGDGFGSKTVLTKQCTPPSGYIRTTGDFDDSTVHITNIAPRTFYRDADGDGYGSPSVSVYYSYQPSGYVTNSSDCNDGDATLNPNTPWFRDNDGDGYGSGGAPVFSCLQPSGYSRNSGDCNDYDGSISPATVWYRDADGDGYGTSSGTTASCFQPSGYVRNASDYNDGTANITNIAPQTFYRDADGDGYGSPTVTIYYSNRPAGYVTNSSDCNDTDWSLNPTTVWYRDVDGDGYGISTLITTSCTAPSGYARISGDCNDYDNTLSPATIWYLDADGDGYGTSSNSSTSCTPLSGYVRNASDYNDTTANIINIAPQTFYRDADGDGYGTATVTVYYSIAPTGYVTNSNDYDDTTVNITNIAPSTFYRDVDGDTFGSHTVTVYYSVKPVGYVTNSSDYDDSTVNITNIAPRTYYRDQDGDGFGNGAVSLYYSIMPLGYVANNTDCNDQDYNSNPNTKWYADVDGDGLGDPASFVTQCTAPAGYVLDATDNCPNVPGTNADCSSLPNPSQDMNYIITRAYQQATSTPFLAPSPEQAQVQIIYFDGLGRPMQQIANQQSATGKDIVTPIEYDAYGRQTKDYLSYVPNAAASLNYKPSALTDVLNFPQYYGQNPYSEKLFEASPLHRVLKQAAPGSDWALNSGHEIKLDYQTNTANEVKRFDVSLTADYVPSITANASYATSELYKTVTTDENNNPIEEFKDKEGHVVLKRNYDNSVAHDTYYVYDVYGNLTYVLPPKAEGATTAEVLDELCYQYQYDYRNRLVAKKLPGKQWEFMVYDKLDRVVATGPAFSPFSDVTGAGWLITKYDVFNRVVYTGWLNSVQVNSTERSTMQQTQNNATTINESKQASGTIDTIAVNYSNNVAPTSFKLLSVNYYDDYAIPNVSGLATSVDNQTVTTATKGLATGSWTRVPTTTAEVKAEMSYTLYDYKYRPIRSYTTNYLGGYTYTDSKLDAFSGQLQYTVQKHKRTSGDSELTVKEAFTYSPQKRLLTHTHQINGGVVQLLAENTYDELGKLTSKKVGNTSATPLQKVDYSYNIRGWLTKINEIGSLQQGADPADLFGFKLNYNIVEGSATAANKLYNGNIAETFWRTATDGGFVRNYGYKYDNLNRLKDATYQKSGQVTGMYNENLSYDKNGNIMNLSRYGDRDEQYLPIQIDNLGYNYGTNSNQLKSVTDATNNTSGFKDGNTTGDDYVYDVNGNMTVDKNKNITGIVYNHLNLPTKIIFPTGNIVYIYTASGQKIQKVVTENTTVTTTDYLGGYQYRKKNASEPVELQFFPTVEGYVKNTPVSGTNTYSYVFNYTDHLGNTRLSYTKDTTTGSLKILEENNYYPFGLKHTPYNADNFQPDYKYKFQEQERQDELGLNWDSFKYRNYDYAIGRFMGIDPLAEKYSYQSPYNFSENQVIAYRELEGLEKVHYTYTFTKDKVSVAKTSINGPLGNGVLVSSNHGGKMTYYYGNTIASSLVAFKKAYEGNNIDAKGNHVGYNDHLGNPTIGYGHKIVDGDTFTVGSKISEKKAQSLFESDSKWIINSADEYLEDFDLNQNQTNALYDAAFNMGPGRLSEYTEDGSKFSGGNFFLQFMGGGDGLKKRRYAENILYNEGESVHLDRLKGKSMEQITDYLNSLLKKDEKKK